jgi:hypothetical protein
MVLNALSPPPTAAPASKTFGQCALSSFFADKLYGDLPHDQDMLESGEERPGQGQLDAGLIYIVLHGVSSDGTSFQGEVDFQRLGRTVAFTLDDVPMLNGSVAFVASCWGGLIVDERARDAGSTVTPRGPDASIALRFLRNGAAAYIGSTGSHMTPCLFDQGSSEGLRLGAAPLHSALWKRLLDGAPPARALFEAKQEFVGGIPHAARDQVSIALEFKVLHELTCLGLGW